MPGPSAQARGGDACFKPPKTSAWGKGRLSSTRFPSPRPRAPAPHSLAQAGVLITRGLQREETEGQRGEAPCPGLRSPGVKELKSRL